MKDLKERMCFSTLGCPGWDFDTVLESGSRMGFAAVEIRGIKDQLDNGQLVELSPEHSGRTRMQLQKCQMSIVSLDTSVMLHAPELAARGVEEAKQTIDICRRMNIPYIRVFGDKIENQAEPSESIDMVIRGLEQICSYARQDVGVLLEIHGDFNTAEALAPILENFRDTPAFGLIWDVEHSFRNYGNSMKEFYNLIRPYIRHVHIKDCRMEQGKALPCLMGQGEIELPSLIRMLEEDGYPGMYSFEWEKRWHPLIEEPEVAFLHFVQYMYELDY